MVSLASPSCGDLAEQMPDLQRRVFGGVERHNRDADFLLPGEDVVDAAIRSFQKRLPDFFVAEREFYLEFAIADDELPGGRKLDRERIVGEDGDYIIVLCEVQKEVASLRIGTIEIAGDEDEMIAASNAEDFPEDFVKSMVRGLGVVSGVKKLVLADEDFKDAQDCSTAATWPDFFSGLVIEDQGADAIPLLKDTPGSKRGSFCGDDGLHIETATKEHVYALVDNEERGTVTLFGINADKRLLHARCYVPIDHTNVVTENIVAEFFKIEASATHTGTAATGQQTMNRL